MASSQSSSAPSKPKKYKFDQAEDDRLTAQLGKYYGYRSRILELKAEIRDLETKSDQLLARKPALANVVGYARKRARVAEEEPDTEEEEKEEKKKKRKAVVVDPKGKKRESTSREKLEKKLKREQGTVSHAAREEHAATIKGAYQGTHMELE